jgi:stage V sporulation protein SpoVS
MAYTRGSSSEIIVGAAALFTADSTLDANTVPAFVSDESYKETLSNSLNTEVSAAGVENVGYTSNGIEITFQPDFGEVQVDQILDVAKLYKQGMQVTLATSFAEATLENLLFAIAGNSADLSGSKGTSSGRILDLKSGDIGECPVERALIAVGPGTGDCVDSSSVERVYIAYRALSIENVTVSAKRDTATMFDVTFRLLPEDASGSYVKIVDRTIQES